MTKFLTALSLFALLAAVPAAQADCQSAYAEAMSKIGGAKQKALAGEKLDSGSFMNDFQSSMNKLQAGRCNTEIMQLLQFVQMEKQMYPAPAQNTPSTGFANP